MKSLMNKICCVFLLILVGGCASYNPHQIKLLAVGKTGVVEAKSDKENSNVKILVSVLSKDEEKYYFDRNIFAAGYRTAQLTIINSSDECIIIKNEDVILQIANSEQIAKILHTSTGGRVAAYGVGGLVFFPLFVPAVVDGVKSSDANKKINADFNERCGEYCVIPAHSIQNHILFINKMNSNQSFDVLIRNYPQYQLLEKFHVSLL